MGLLAGDLVTEVCLLVVAKAPVPGLAKTRLAATLGDDVAADIAAAALLDTLDAVADTPAAARVVALTGNLADARRVDEIRSRLADFTVIPQRGDGFGARLANAHLDAAGGRPVVQIGMDTPQVDPELLVRCARRLDGHDAVLGMAHDGGWWVLGVRDAVTAGCLRDVPMSSPDTGALTLAALQRNGLQVTLTDELADVDTIGDIGVVRGDCRATSRFRRITATVSAGEA
jgi:rSAM/selenodomain-associated transferase 1